MLRKRSTIRNVRRLEAGDARWWLLGVVALSVLGWIWLQRSPSPSSEDLPVSTPPVLQAQPPGAEQKPKRETSGPGAASNPSTSTKEPPARQQPAAPLDLTPGASNELGVVVIRSNRPPPAAGGTNAAAPGAVEGSAAAAAGPLKDMLSVQLSLARHGISPGSLDGKHGSQTRSALRAFQEREGLPASGILDAATQRALALDVELTSLYLVLPDDLARLRPLAKTWLAKSEQDRMDYESVLELVAEKSQSHPALIKQLNPAVDWDHMEAGATLVVPNPDRPPLKGRPAVVKISLGNKTLQAFDADGKLMLHFPCSIARDKEKRPVGELHVEKVAVNPNYTFNPDVFPESEEARELKRKLVLQPGPNNPVGAAWISLDRPGYGIHGTPNPEQVGRTESHGCFRLANWNAEQLVRIAWIGLPVQVDP
ncbi:MAG: peptidoglycan-binding protein [Verrucomicrobia bacterium]|nr:peptidoglycan-binding protein [Verrucomicrobiota bacterium]MBI3867617.1 peptidoglycan-binding protein [Verrucomicrobiota bacterium]